MFWSVVWSDLGGNLKQILRQEDFGGVIKCAGYGRYCTGYLYVK